MSKTKNYLHTSHLIRALLGHESQLVMSVFTCIKVKLCSLQTVWLRLAVVLLWNIINLYFFLTGLLPQTPKINRLHTLGSSTLQRLVTKTFLLNLHREKHPSCYSLYVGGLCLIKARNRMGVQNDPPWMQHSNPAHTNPHQCLQNRSFHQ